MPGIAPTDGSHAAAGLQNQLPLKVAIAYSRVSTSRQSSEIKSGFDRQQEGIDKWAAAHPDYEIEQTVRHIGSGAKGGRFDWFITALQKGNLPAGTCLVVDDWSRFSREPMTDVLETLIKVFRVGGAIAVCSLGGEVLENLDNQQGQIFMIAGAITSARAEWEMKQARTKAAVEKRRQAIREGNYVPAPRTDSRTSVDFPFWINVDEDGQFVLNEHAAMVKRRFALGASGLGSTRIARALNEEGLSIRVQSRTDTPSEKAFCITGEPWVQTLCFGRKGDRRGPPLPTSRHASGLGRGSGRHEEPHPRCLHELSKGSEPLPGAVCAAAVGLQSLRKQGVDMDISDAVRSMAMRQRRLQVQRPGLLELLLRFR